jgi:hypothetical protein
MPSQLTHLSSPGNQVTRDLAGKPLLIDEFHKAWTARLQETIARPPRPLFYDPVKVSTADDVDTATQKWTAFPKRMHPDTAKPTMNDFRQGDNGPDDPNYDPPNSRGWQDEYCEWMVEKNAAGKIVRVVFTCENPDYWDQLWHTNKQTVVDLYKQFIDNTVIQSDLEDANGKYVWENKWNNSVNHAMHLVSAPNNLFAEIRLASNATVLRKRPDGIIITNQDELIRCADFGRPGRHSDPSIGAAVNGLARDEHAGQITLRDPFGLYIDKASLNLASGFQLPATAPAGAHARDYWKILRGTDDFVLRVEYSVPAALGFTVGDITIDGELIKHGGQIAEKMQIQLTAQYASIQAASPPAIICHAPEILGFLNSSLEQIELRLPPGASRATRLLCSAKTGASATIREFKNRVTLTIGTDIPISNLRFKVFNATVVVSASADSGAAFFEATNSDGTNGVWSDPGLEISPSISPLVPFAAAAAPAAESAVPSDRLVTYESMVVSKSGRFQLPRKFTAK